LFYSDQAHNTFIKKYYTFIITLFILNAKELTLQSVVRK
jgi:hypothetical protein